MSNQVRYSHRFTLWGAQEYATTLSLRAGPGREQSPADDKWVSAGFVTECRVCHGVERA